MAGKDIMRPRRILAITIAMVCLCGAVGAQWLHYPTADVPRTKDGKPNLSASAPRLPDGKPDFSGIWQPGRKIACTPEFSKFVECGLEIGGSPLALNIGADLPGGLPFQPWAAALVKQRTAENSKDDPHARCLPDNPPRPYGLPHMTKAVHTPRLLVLLNEVNAMYRQIFIDGRPLPKISIRPGTGTRLLPGTVTRWWFAPTASETVSGSTWAARR